MTTTYVVHVESGCEVDAHSAADAKQQAIEWLVSELLSGRLELQVDEEVTQ